MKNTLNLHGNTQIYIGVETIFCSSDKLANHKKVIVDDDFHYIINITRKGKYCQVISGICKNVDVIKEITTTHSV